MGRNQGGYLLGMPLLVLAAIGAVALLVPKLPPTWTKVVLVLGAMGVLRGLHYMLMSPGWHPGAQSGKTAWQKGAFLFLALLIGAGALAFVMTDGDTIQALFHPAPSQTLK